MTSLALKSNAAHAAQIIALAPILFAALIGAIPLIIPCITCRCCKRLIARFKETHRRCQ